MRNVRALRAGVVVLCTLAIGAGAIAGRIRAPRVAGGSVGQIEPAEKVRTVRMGLRPTVPKARVAYKNRFLSDGGVESVRYVPGPSVLLVDVRTTLAGPVSPNLLSYAVVNKNPGFVLFDSTITIYADAGGAPNLAAPIGAVTDRDLFAPPGQAIGVAKMYLGDVAPFQLPPGRVWFAAEISNIRGGDPGLFGQACADAVTIGSSTGAVQRLDAQGPTLDDRGDEVANLDRTIAASLPSASDWVIDGRVDQADLHRFLTDFLAVPPRADFDLDGVTTQLDLRLFLLDYGLAIR